MPRLRKFGKLGMRKPLGQVGQLTLVKSGFGGPQSFALMDESGHIVQLISVSRLDGKVITYSGSQTDWLTGREAPRDYEIAKKLYPDAIVVDSDRKVRMRLPGSQVSTMARMAEDLYRNHGIVI